MRVVFGYRYGILGGVCTQLLNRVAGFRAQPNIEVHLAFGRDHGISAALADHPRHVFAKRPKDLAGYCRRQAIDVVSIIDTPEMLAACKTLLRRWRLVLEVHTTYDAGLGYLDELGRAARHLHAIVVPSAYSERLVRQRLRSDVPIHRVGNCVDPAIFRPSEAQAAGPPICLWVGKLDEHKNWRGFLRIAAKLHSQRSDLRFWLVGGATAPAAIKQELQAKLGELGLSDAVRWLPVVPYSEMADVYGQVAASGGVLVVTSRDESFGMSVAESILCGCPVVASNVGALPELIEEREALALYPLDDTEAAVALIEERLETSPPSLAVRKTWHDGLAARISPPSVCASLARVFQDC